MVNVKTDGRPKWLSTGHRRVASKFPVCSKRCETSAYACYGLTRLCKFVAKDVAGDVCSRIAAATKPIHKLSCIRVSSRESCSNENI